MKYKVVLSVNSELAAMLMVAIRFNMRVHYVKTTTFVRNILVEFVHLKAINWGQNVLRQQKRAIFTSTYLNHF
jgi:hypothetical protein